MPVTSQIRQEIFKFFWQKNKRLKSQKGDCGKNYVIYFLSNASICVVKLARAINQLLNKSTTFWNVMALGPVKFKNVLKKHTASTFRVKE
jgi:hypothetical protein